YDQITSCFRGWLNELVGGARCLCFSVLFLVDGTSYLTFKEIIIEKRLVSALEAGVLQNWQAADSKDNLDLV
ncbi:hypothetical protein H0E87_007993, partial [Populus deltoides]